MLDDTNYLYFIINDDSEWAKQSFYCGNNNRLSSLNVDSFVSNSLPAISTRPPKSSKS